MSDLKIEYPLAGNISQEIAWLLDHGFLQEENSAPYVFSGNVKGGKGGIPMCIGISYDFHVRKWSAHATAMLKRKVCPGPVWHSGIAERAIELAVMAWLRKWSGDNAQTSSSSMEVTPPSMCEETAEESREGLASGIDWLGQKGFRCLGRGVTLVNPTFVDDECATMNWISPKGTIMVSEPTVENGDTESDVGVCGSWTATSSEANVLLIGFGSSPQEAMADLFLDIEHHPRCLETTAENADHQLETEQ